RPQAGQGAAEVPQPGKPEGNLDRPRQAAALAGGLCRPGPRCGRVPDPGRSRPDPGQGRQGRAQAGGQEGPRQVTAPYVETPAPGPAFPFAPAPAAQRFLRAGSSRLPNSRPATRATTISITSSRA